MSALRPLLCRVLSQGTSCLPTCEVGIPRNRNASYVPNSNPAAPPTPPPIIAPYFILRKHSRRLGSSSAIAQCYTARADGDAQLEPCRGRVGSPQLHKETEKIWIISCTKSYGTCGKYFCLKGLRNKHSISLISMTVLLHAKSWYCLFGVLV